jgi:hypothetical protein
MVNAVNKLASNLPILADHVADFVDWIVNNPWQAAGLAGGLKVGTSFLGGALPTGGKAITEAMSKKLAASNNKLAKSAGAAAGKLGGLAGAAGGILGAGAAGVAAGTLFNQLVADPANKKYNQAWDSAVNASSGTPSTIEGKRKSIANLRKQSVQMAANFATPENAFGFIASAASRTFGKGHVESPLEQLQGAMTGLVKTQERLQRSMEKQIRITENSGKAMQNAFPDKGSARGPIETPPPRPGHEPVRG